MVRLLTIWVVLALAAPLAAQAENLFNPNAQCADELEKTHEDFVLIRTGWALGYLAARSGDIAGFGEGPFEELIEKIEAACKATPGASYLDIVKSME